MIIAIKEEECEDLITLLNYEEAPIYLIRGIMIGRGLFNKINEQDYLVFK